VRLTRGYDAVTASASLANEVVLAITGVDPVPLAAHDVAYTTTIALAETPRGTRLVQVDADVVAERSERLRPRLDAFRATGWMHESVDPYYAVSASISVGHVTIQRLRYVSKPEELAFSGTESVGGG
jgi:hypothetical protein